MNERALSIDKEKDLTVLYPDFAFKRWVKVKEIRSVIVILSLSYLSMSRLVDNVELFWVNVSAKIHIVCTLWAHM